MLLMAGCANNGGIPLSNTTGGGTGQPPKRIATPLPGQSAPAESIPAPAVADTTPQIVAPPTQGQGQSLVISGATRDIPASMLQSRVRVGMLLPLSGPRREVGRSLLDAAMLAINDVAGDNFVLLPFDTRGTEQGAKQAMQDALDNKVHLVIGPLFSSSVAAAAPEAISAGVNVIAFSNNRLVAQPGVFLSGLLPEAQIDRVVRFAATRGIRRIAALLPYGAFGDRVHRALQQTANSLGLDLVNVAYFTSDSDQTERAVRNISDFDERQANLKRQIAALKGKDDEVSKRTLARLEKMETYGPLPYDALVVAASGTKLTEVAAQLGYFDIDTKTVRLLGISSWNAPGTGREPALDGGWFADTPEAATADFNRNFKAMYETNPHPLAVDAYDVTALAAILAGDGPDKAYDTQSLTRKSGFSGATGLFRFDASGLPQRALEVREVTQEGSKLVDPAPKTFPPVIN